jgi:hypothetical protein
VAREEKTWCAPPQLSIHPEVSFCRRLRRRESSQAMPLRNRLERTIELRHAHRSCQPSMGLLAGWGLPIRVSADLVIVVAKPRHVTGLAGDS